MPLSKANNIFLLFLTLNGLSAAASKAPLHPSFFDFGNAETTRATYRSLLETVAETPPGNLILEMAEITRKSTGLELLASEGKESSAEDLILEGMESAFDSVRTAEGSVVFVSTCLHQSRIANVKQAIQEVRASREAPLDAVFAHLVNRFSPKNDNFRNRVIKALANISAVRFTPTFIEMVESYSFTQGRGVLDGYSVASFIDAIGKFEPPQLGIVEIEFTPRKELLLSLPPIERDRLLNRLHEIFLVPEIPPEDRIAAEIERTLALPKVKPLYSPKQ